MVIASHVNSDGLVAAAVKLVKGKRAVSTIEELSRGMNLARFKILKPVFKQIFVKCCSGVSEQRLALHELGKNMKVGSEMIKAYTEFAEGAIALQLLYLQVKYTMLPREHAKLFVSIIRDCSESPASKQ